MLVQTKRFTIAEYHRLDEIGLLQQGDRRGTYAGAYGYYDFEGQLNTAITIRTMVTKDGTASVQAGAGVVADSDPEKEYQETLNKAKGMLESLRCLG